MKYADLDNVSRLDLAAAAGPGAVGVVDNRHLHAGYYELRATGPLAMKIATPGTALAITDLVIDPAAGAFVFRMKRAGTVLFAATNAAIQAWVIPLLEE